METAGESRQLTWREVVGKSAAFLASKGVPDSAVAAELLAARLLGVGRGFLSASLDRIAEERHLAAMRRGMARLAKGEPLQYVLGEWDFRTLTLKCDRRALIPRPETEGLVSLVLEWLRGADHPAPPLVVDVGTGTGAIVLSLAKEYGGEATFLGTDVSEDAVALARENAERCLLADRVGFAVMDGLDDFDESQCMDAIVSNPPYIESAVVDTLAPRVRNFEPRLALDGGPAGLDFYDRYLADALNLLKAGGAVFFEIGDTQGEAVRRMMESYGFGDIRIAKDLSGRDRYASATLT